MYESPIDIIYSDMQMKLENKVFKAVLNVGINVDKDELIKALSYERQQYEKGYADAKAEQQWIPTSIRPPKDFDRVYIQTKWGDHEICKYIPKKVKPKEYPDGFWGDADCPEYDYFDVDAWMPLPEPYREV